MSEAGYIEITNSEVAEAKNELNATEPLKAMSEDPPSEKFEIEIVGDDAGGEPKDGAESLKTAGSEEHEMTSQEGGPTVYEQQNSQNLSAPDDSADGTNPDTAAAPKPADIADPSNYEVIDGPEEEQDRPEEKIEKQKGELSISEDATEEKPSPFRRFRSFTRPEKKDSSVGSSITIPAIFSTPFMSLKNIGKRKESPADDQQPVNEDHTPSPGNTVNTEQLRIERKNLLGMAKLSIKGLIESSLSAGHTLDSDHNPLQQFFVIMESVLKHGLKSPKLFFAGNKQFWGPLEAIEKITSDASVITNSVRELPGVKTHAGRARAWLRLALMQKRLADYFRLMVEHRDVMQEYYEQEALIMSEEGVVLSGHLVGLNCIDANLCMKGDNLDNQTAVIDYSVYIKDGNRSISAEPTPAAEQEETVKSGEAKSESENTEDKMRELANQKNYLEERNRYLETTLSELQKRAGHTSSSNQLLEAELEAAKISLTTLREEKEKWIAEKQELNESHKKALKDRQADLDTERETLVQSRAGLDEMLNQVKKQLKQEALMRMDTEREVELQIAMKQEMEVAMKLLEKDIYDKQDSLVILREQLENVKGLNIDIYKKLQDKTDAAESKTRAITELEEETKRLDTEVKKLKENLSVLLDKIDEKSEVGTS